VLGYCNFQFRSSATKHHFSLAALCIPGCPLFQADRCRVLAAECRRLALMSETALEKTLLTNLAFGPAGSWVSFANRALAPDVEPAGQSARV
jgi:hypothetical protein